MSSFNLNNPFCEKKIADVHNFILKEGYLTEPSFVFQKLNLILYCTSSLSQ